MQQSLLILGRQPSLGLAELESLYGADRLQPIGKEATLLAIAPESVDFSRIGGSIKLCRVFDSIDTTNWADIQKHLEQKIPQLIDSMPDGKITIGISAYGLNLKPQQLVAAGLTIKKILRGKNRSVRLVPNQSYALNSAQVLHNHLTNENGCEIVLVRDGNKAVIAQTIAEQDIESYTLRDRGRPKRDARVGMLPPKLAQIIINLSNPSPGSCVLDPFCGTGVLLQEALLMNFSVYGTDMDQRMIDYSRSNLEWLLAREAWLRNNVEDHKSRSIILERQDATNFKANNVAGVESVASETYLGRPFTTPPIKEILDKTVEEVNTILKKFLQNIHGQLAAGTRLCLAVPAWQTAPGKFTHLPLIDRLGDLGYNHVRFELVRNEELLYYREDQIVARELLVLTRK